MLIFYLWVPEGNVINPSKKVPCDDGTCIFALYDSSEMEIAHTDNKKIILKKGDKVVFKYAYYPNSRDNEYYIMFEIPRERRFFNFQDKRLQQLNAYLGKANSTDNDNVIPLEKGQITGYKIADGLWHVEFDVNTSDFGIPVKFNASEVFGRD